MSKTSKTSRRLGALGAAVLGVAGIATVALAQTPNAATPESAGPANQAAGGYGMMSHGMGPGMMGCHHGMGPGMMGGLGPDGRWGGPNVSVADRLAALKDKLRITADETGAWNSYATAVTAAEREVRNGMKSLWQTTANGPMTPDQRFDAMSKTVTLMKQSYDQKKTAADALLKHLSPYQQGQASEILPGLATTRGGYGWRGGMMGSSTADGDW
jgi:LTXXQ motif family protein